jgi:hypothetical protein
MAWHPRTGLIFGPEEKRHGSGASAAVGKMALDLDALAAGNYSFDVGGQPMLIDTCRRALQLSEDFSPQLSAPVVGHDSL